jgi:signal transduction histidine kinase
VLVEIGCDAGGTLTRIVDDGRGFAAGAGATVGLGMTGMRERAALTGGRLEVRSGPGKGTTVELRLGRRA